MIAARQIFLGRGGSAKLPYDAEVEYLELTNAQYIDTGLTVSDKTEFEFWFYADAYSNTFFPIFGVYGNSVGLGVQRNFGGSPYGILVWRGSDTKKLVNDLNAGAYTGIVSLHDGTFSFFGQTMTVTAGTFQSTATAWYGRVNGFSAYGDNKRIGYLKMWEDGILVRDLIPVRFTNELGQSEGAMYDKVSGQLFRNQGTGELVLGPDIIDYTAKDYIQDGLVAMWDGIENAGWGTHDPSATVWKDLVGTRDATLSGSFAWGSNFWDVQSVSGKGLATWDGSNLPSSQTLEIVIYPSATTQWGRIIAEGQEVASPIIRNNPDRLHMYGYGIDAYTNSIDGYSNLDLHSHVIVHPSGGPLDYYIDGVLKWTHITSTDSTGYTSAFFANRADFQRGLDAKYHCVRIYSRALTAEEIAHNYLIDKARFGL